MRFQLRTDKEAAVWLERTPQSSALPRRGASESPTSLQRWLSLIANLTVLALIVAAVIAQLSAARDTALNADEALHFELVNYPSLAAALRRVVTNAHPPLFFLVLYFWIRLGRSELFLRLLPIVFGGGFLWFLYRWVSRLFGQASGLIAFFVVFFSPAWLPLSSELRDYSLSLLLIVASLYAFESALEASSPRRMVLFAVVLSLAILTHYGVLFVVASLFVYAALRLYQRRSPRGVALAWAGSQGIAALLYLVLYFTQVRKLRGGNLESRAMNSWLSTGYFQTTEHNPLAFVGRQIEEIFAYLLGPRPIAIVGLVLAAGGVFLLVARRRGSAVLLALPWVLGALAGLLRLYPFSSTRHSIYLLPFASAAIGVTLSTLIAGKLPLAYLATLTLFPFYRPGPLLPEAPRNLSRINVAIGEIRKRVPEGSLVFSDYNTYLLLRYYLGRDSFSAEEPGSGGFSERDSGGYCVVGDPNWSLNSKTFAEQFAKFISLYRLPPGQHLWVMCWGFEFDVVGVLSRKFPNSFARTVLRSDDIRLVVVEVLL